MTAFIEPLKMALIVFPILSFMILIPFMIHQYRKYGSILIIRSIIIFSFIYYLMSAYFLVVLPLPSRSSVTNSYADMMQLRPFQFILDLQKHWVFDFRDRSTYVKGLTQAVFTQLIFNVFLTLPFGVYLRYYFKKNMKTTVFYTFCLSLFFELSQLSGLFFIYPGPYRLFDVDDLMLNTLGGLLGFLIGPFFESFLPSRDKLDRISYQKAERLSLLKRGFAFFLDVVILNLLVQLIEWTIGTKSILVGFLAFMFYFSALPFASEGQTIIQKFLSIKVLDDNGNKPSFLAFIIRSFLIYVFIYRSRVLLLLVSDLMLIAESRLFAIVYLILVVLWLFFYLLYWFMVLIKRPRQLFYDRLSHVHLISVFNAKE